MAFVGISLILATVIYVAIRRPPLIETLWAILRGYPQIEQPSSTRPPPTPPSDDGRQREQEGRISGEGRKNDDDKQSSSPKTTRTAAAMVTASIIANGSVDDSATTEQSPQTTPKATAIPEPSSSAHVPTLNLSSTPPASAASLARTTDAVMPPSAPPSLSKLSPTPSLMPPPPPRLPTLNKNLPTSSSHLSPAPSRAPTTTRQPGTSTLAPPPTHSSKPAKPSRKVILKPGHSPLDWARLANSATSDLRNLPPGTAYLRVTPSMLKRQTGRKGKDAWTALGGRVYNITPYLPFHPGGEPELLRVAGRDGTNLFGEIHPWVNYEGMLATSLIGMLVEEHEGNDGAMDEMD